MTAADPPRRRPRAFWGDTRFLLGLLLVVASVVGVWLVVGAARQSEPVLAAARTIVPGEAVSGADLRVVEATLGQVGGAYLTPATLSEGAVATRTIAEGELVPAGSIAAGEDLRATTVVVRTGSEVSAAVVEGATVELWHAPPLEDGRFDTPRILVADATVSAVTRDDAVLGGADASVELVIPRADVSAVLAAQSGGSVLSVVPAGG